MAFYRYILKRLVIVLPTLIGASIVVFLLIHIIPGDPVTVMLGERATEAARQALIEKMGLDQPLPVQYWNWFSGALKGDFGTSIRTNTAVISEIFSRLPATIELTLVSSFIAVFFGIIFGVTAARYRNSIADQMAIGFSLLGVSIPIFWLGMMMIFFFAVVMGWLPVSGRLSLGLSINEVTGLYLIDTLITGNMRAFWDALRHLAMPASALATVSLALYVRVTRSSMLDVLSEDYVRTARAKGLRMNVVIYKHALKNALIPIVTVIGLSIAQLLGGAVLTETVFSWPGIGRLLITSIGYRDYPMIQGIVLFVVLAFIFINLLVDIIYAYLDPRIRY
jgi:ABC-type dipeptide/oligopeptide/nickel transport system permease component